MKTIKMKTTNNITTMLLLAVMGLSLFSCNTKSTNNSTENSQEPQAETIIETIEASVSGDQTNSILASYLKIKDALVNTDSNATSEAAGELLSALGDSTEDLIGKIKAAADQIKSTNDVEQQRKYFDALSQNVYALVKSASSNENPVYKQYCPMAFNNTGAFWLSSEKEVLNPYFGDKMLRCGRVQETIE